MASAVAAASAVLAVGAAGAGAAATLPNSATVHLANYAILQPFAPQYVPNGRTLPDTDGWLGNPVNLMTGSTPLYSGSQVAEIPGGSSSLGIGVRTNDVAGTSAQRWYFQRMGWIGLHSPQVDGVRTVVGAPVYRMINFDANGGHTCLDAAGGTGAAESPVVSNGCDLNNPTSQLWAVASSAQVNNTFNATTGLADGHSVRQIFSPTLQQGLQATATGLQNSVLFNVASLQAHGWDTTQTPVLSAAVDNINGYHSALWLKPQDEWPVRASNSTWTIAAIVPAGSGTSSCAGLTGMAIMLCGIWG